MAIFKGLFLMWLTMNIVEPCYGEPNAEPSQPTDSQAQTPPNALSAFDKATDRTCLLVSNSIQVKSKDGTSSIPIRKGRIVPTIAKEPSTRTFTIHLAQGDFIIKEADVKIGNAGLCSIEPLCAVTKLPTVVYEDAAFDAKKMAQVGKGARLGWYGKRNIKKTNTNWYQVEAGDGFGWIEASSSDLLHEACKSAALDKRSLQSPWVLQIDAYSESSVSSKDYSGAVTTISDPSSVQSLPDPLIRSFETGKGMRYGANFQYHFNPYFNAGFGFFYAETNFKYLYSANPGSSDMNTPIDTLPPVPLDSLAIESKPFVEQKVILPVNGGVGYTFFRTVRINLSVGTDFQFFVKERKLTLDYYTGTRMKRELNTMEVKPEQFALDPWGEIRLSFLFPNTGNDKFGFSIVGRGSASGAIQAGFSFQL